MSARAVAIVVAVAAATVLAGCLDSLVSGQCAPGWELADGACRPGDGDECPADRTVCAEACVDLDTDGEHCGACGVACPSGLCAAGTCVGAVAGHVVAIGHDYRTVHAASARVLANAVALGGRHPVRVALWAGDAGDATTAAITAALELGMPATGRAWTQVAAQGLPPADRTTTDVWIAAPQRAAAGEQRALGTAWAERLDRFVAAGGVVVALAGPDAGAMELVAAAGLLDLAPAATASGQVLQVVALTDALAVGVPSPYLGAAGTTAFRTAGDPGTIVVTTPAGEPVVVHQARLP